MGITTVNIKECMAYHHVTGLSITGIENAQISFANHYGALEAGTTKIVNKDTLFNACSISKFLTGMLVMPLCELGLFDLDEDINQKLISWKVPNHKYGESKYVTLRNLLCHQSGIIDPEDSFMELRTDDGFPSMVDLLNGKTPYCKKPIQLKYEPESDFQYSDAGYCIVQLLVEDLTGKTFQDLAEELIFQPLEMLNSTLTMTIPAKDNYHFSCGHDKNGELVDGKYTIYPYPAASGLWTTPSDLAKLVLELINALHGNGNILSEGKAKELISSQGCKEWTGLSVFLDHSKEELEISSLGWGMGFQCMMVAYPYRGTGFVIMTNTDLGVHQLEGIIGDIYQSYDFGS
ncbi:serine hydrolase domain-containing protein [Neobacillus dielmonensis]|uniref:serine hydrolase domain-containing protein n=1 Tax=Neobacillus dielmonensis TaxID=1347369 RepID=UPI0005A9788D|nr:serine hydrolase domain-containing protein [Neobacillus dielmonensis]